MRAFCDVGHCFQDTPFQTCKTEIFEVRPTHFPIFLTARAIIQKSSCQSLGSIYVISILERQVLRMHTTLKTLRRNLEQYSCYNYLCTHVKYDCTNSCNTNLLHRLLKDRINGVVMPA